LVHELPWKKMPDWPGKLGGQSAFCACAGQPARMPVSSMAAAHRPKRAKGTSRHQFRSRKSIVASRSPQVCGIFDTGDQISAPNPQNATTQTKFKANSVSGRCESRGGCRGIRARGRVERPSAGGRECSAKNRRAQFGFCSRGQRSRPSRRSARPDNFRSDNPR
jgi:hypothetical protein